MPVPYAAIAAAAAPAAIGLLGKKNKLDEPPEIKAARNLLLNFARTGQYGDFKAGAEVPLGYGDFNATGIEQSGMSKLQSLINSPLPSGFDAGDNALYDFLKTNPADVSAQFDPFKTQTERQITQDEQAHRRASAFAGNLYSTDTIRRLGDVRARGNETLTSKLAELTDSALNRRLQAIPLAYQGAEARDNAETSRIGTAFNYGGLTRNLNDASIKARDAELLRRRKELQLPIEAAGQVLSGPSQLPIEQSPYQALLGTVGQIGGQYLGNELFMNQYKRFFPSGTPGKA